MDITLILIGIVISIAIVVGFYFYFKSNPSGSTNVVSSQDGTHPLTSNVVLPPSLNQKEGLTMSYTFWVRIDDFNYNYGKQRIILTKGPIDLSSMCPGVLLDPTTNTILVKIDTFGVQEIVSIPNIPAKKWLHFGIVIDQDSVDVYVNGRIHTHHTLVQLPRDNPSSLTVGGGFRGRVANIKYYNYFISQSDIESDMKVTPSPSTDELNSSMPPYFDITWWE